MSASVCLLSDSSQNKSSDHRHFGNVLLLYIWRILFSRLHQVTHNMCIGSIHQHHFSLKLPTQSLWASEFLVHTFQQEVLPLHLNIGLPNLPYRLFKLDLWCDWSPLSWVVAAESNLAWLSQTKLQPKFGRGLRFAHTYSWGTTALLAGFLFLFFFWPFPRFKHTILTLISCEVLITNAS